MTVGMELEFLNKTRFNGMGVEADARQFYGIIRVFFELNIYRTDLLFLQIPRKNLRFKGGPNFAQKTK